MDKVSPTYTHVPVRDYTYAKIAAIRDATDQPGWSIVEKAVELYRKHKRIKIKDEGVAPKAGRKSVASAA